jgi:hypothetical protein
MLRRSIGSPSLPLQPAASNALCKAFHVDLRGGGGGGMCRAGRTGEQQGGRKSATNGCFGAGTARLLHFRCRAEGRQALHSPQGSQSTTSCFMQRVLPHQVPQSHVPSKEEEAAQCGDGHGCRGASQLEGLLGHVLQHGSAQLVRNCVRGVEGNDCGLRGAEPAGIGEGGNQYGAHQGGKYALLAIGVGPAEQREGIGRCTAGGGCTS